MYHNYRTMDGENKKIPKRLSDLQRKEKQRRRFLKWLASVFICGVILWGGYVFFVKSDVFRFRELKIEGEERYSATEIQSYLETRVPGGNIIKKFLGYSHFWSWPNEFKENELGGLPGVRSIVFAPDYSNHVLTAVVSEREPVGIWCALKTGNPLCVWFDKDGLAIQNSMLVEGYLITEVNDYSKDAVRLGDYVVPEDEVQNLFSIFDVVKNSGIHGAELRLGEVDNGELQVLPDSGPHLYFSLRFPSSYAAQVLSELSRKPEYKNMQYVDFRIEGKVYYK